MVGPWTLDRPRTEGVASPVSTALGLPAPTRRGPGRPGGLCLNATGRRLSRHSAIGESASGF